MHKSIHSLWSVEKWLHFEDFWEVLIVVVKYLPQEFSILTLVVAFFFSSISSIIYILPWKHVLFSLTNLCNFIHTRWFTTSKEMVAIYSRNSQCCSQENLVLVSYEIHTIFGRYLCLATQCARTILNERFLPKPMTTTEWKETP